MSDISLLEGGADRIGTGGCVAGTDCNLFCGDDALVFKTSLYDGEARPCKHIIRALSSGTYYRI